MNKNTIINNDLSMNANALHNTKKSWSEKTTTEKALTVTAALLSFVSFVFFLLHTTGTFRNSFFLIFLGAGSLVSSFAYRNQNRTVAKLELLAGVFLLISAALQ